MTTSQNQPINQSAIDQTNQPPTKQQPTVPGQPWRTMSTVERDLPQWLKDAMYGTRRSNGTFSGRGGK